jgi:hypothetical protein
MALPLLGRQVVDRLDEFASVIVETELERVALDHQRGRSSRTSPRASTVQREVVTQPVKKVASGLAGFHPAAGFDDIGCSRFDEVGSQKQWPCLASHRRALQFDILFQREPFRNRRAGCQQQYNEREAGQGGQAL